jgi:CHASE2 domain-containing sensor protein
MLGTLLKGQYRIKKVLGSGGFGKTYIANDTRRRQTCVVKHFQPTLRDESVLYTARRLFKAEAQTLGQLGSHERIPGLVDFFEEQQEFYLVQEFIDGTPLDQRIKAGKLMDEAEVVRFLIDVLEILSFVHSNQVIHRDIKPNNLIQRNDGRFVLIDFGAVKALQTELTQMPGQTNLTIGIGTQGYAPSEQLAGKPRYSSDLYALGMTAIQALSGFSPWQLPTHPQTDEVVWHDSLPRPMDPVLVWLLDRMVRSQNALRYQNSEDLLQDLRQWQAGELPLSALTDREETYIRETSAVPGLVRWGAAVDTRPRWKRWSERLGVIGGGALLVTAGSVGLKTQIQPLELGVWDRLIQGSLPDQADSRVVVVGITEADLQALKRFPVADQTLADALQELQRHQPRAIGLDLLRDLPQPPGTQALRQAIQQPNVVAITELGSATKPQTPPPPGVSPDQVGFNDLVLDPDDRVRRHLLFAEFKGQSYSAFGLRLALKYLAQDQIGMASRANHPNEFQLGKATFQPLEAYAGGYGQMDARGYQILARYPGYRGIRQVSLAQVLNRQVDPTWVKGRVVLIGTTAPSNKDLFFTPYSNYEQQSSGQLDGEQSLSKLPGVMIHANLVSQLLSSALEGSSPIQVWPEWAEWAWTGLWSLGMGCWMCLVPRRRLKLFGVGLSLGLILAVGWGLFARQIWIPVATPALGALITAIGVASWQMSRRDRLR